MAKGLRSQEERERVADELQAALADVRSRRPQKNYRVVLQGVAFTEVDMHAGDEDEAMRKAEAWARGVANGDLNHVDFDRAAWIGYEAEEAPE